jgi:hypothetical protein
MVISQKQESILLYVKDKGRIRGPFTRNVIDVMILSGNFSRDIEVRQNEHDSWAPISSPPELPVANNFTNQTTTSKKSSSNSSVKIIAGVCGATILGLILIIAAISSLSKQRGTPSVSSSNYSSTRTTPRPIVKEAPRPASSPIVPFYASTPTPTPYSQFSSYNVTANKNYNYQGSTYTPSSTYSSSDGNDATYRYRQSQAYRLTPLKADMASKKKLVDSTKQRLESLGNEIENERSVLDRSSQYVIDSFNYKVREYNQLKNSYNSYVDQYNASVRAFNAELQSIGRRVGN